MDDIRLKDKYEWLPENISELTYNIVLMRAKGHAISWIAKELKLSQRGVGRLIHEFYNEHPEYAAKLEGIVNSHCRLRYNLKHLLPLDELDEIRIKEYYGKSNKQI